MKIPILYRVVMDKVCERCYNNVIETGQLRFLLRLVFRIPHQQIQGLYRELQEYGLIKFKNHKLVEVKWKPKD